jgi:hypothetical protein
MATFRAAMAAEQSANPPAAESGTITSPSILSPEAVTARSTSESSPRSAESADFQTAVDGPPPISSPEQDFVVPEKFHEVVDRLTRLYDTNPDQAEGRNSWAGPRGTGRGLGRDDPDCGRASDIIDMARSGSRSNLNRVSTKMSKSEKVQRTAHR